MITGRISAQEYVAAGLLSRRRMSLVWYGIASGLAAVGIILFFTAPKPGIVLAAAGIGGLIGGFIDNRLYAPSRLRRLHAQLKLTDVTITWDEHRLTFSSEQGHSSHAWTDFRKAQENDEFILLYHNDALFQIIAKRWFATAADLESFKQHVKFAA